MRESTGLTKLVLVLLSIAVSVATCSEELYQDRYEIFRLAGRNFFSEFSVPFQSYHHHIRRDSSSNSGSGSDSDPDSPDFEPYLQSKGSDHGIRSSGASKVSSSTKTFPWHTATRKRPVESASATPIKETAPVRFTIKPGQVHKYELSNIYFGNNNQTNVFVTLNTCQEPYINEQLDLKPDQSLSLYAAEANKTGEQMDGMLSVFGFANVTLTNVKHSTAVATIYAPDIGQKFHGEWTYEIGMSTMGPVHGVSSSPNLYLVDTDYAHALFVTGNFTKQADGNFSSTDDYNIYAYTALQEGQEDYIAKFNRKLAGSYCAISSGPALLNTKNTNVSTTTRGYGNDEKGQYFMRGLNKSTTYLAYLTQPNINMRGGIVFQPVNFTSKTETNCQVVYGLDFCSDVAFAVPGNASAYTARTLARFYDNMAEARYKNFSLSLQNVNCNASDEARYSIMRNCTNCADSYKQWLCAVTIPRCTDWSNNDTFLKPRPEGTSRNPQVNEIIRPGKYKEILPCADLCYRIVQDCDPNLGFACPRKGKELDASYGQYSDDGYVSCSYPGAVYFLSGVQSTSALLLGSQWLVGLVLFWSMYML